MPVGLRPPTDLLPVPGIRLAAVYAGLRKTPRDDLVLFELRSGSRTAATFTRNRFYAAPVSLAKAHLSAAEPRFLLINAGNANAGTGSQGLSDARQCCQVLAELAGCSPEQVLPFSTGVIGQPLPVDKIAKALPRAVNSLDDDAWLTAANGIMTTDTQPKGASRQLTVNGRRVTISGIAKGAGMICPDMATMLSFIATDAAIDAALLSDLHTQAVEGSFNRITIDGDTSTNDACVLVATGASGVEVKKDAPDYQAFVTALESVYLQLAHAIVRDAEGATKFVTVCIEQGASVDDCRTIAYTVAHSPLVKTALYASDANWGRILAAVGRAGVAIDIARVGIEINGASILRQGQPDPGYTEEAGAAAMAAEEIVIRIELGLGEKSFTVWTSDLSHEYVSINADYRS
ncbi:MAG TPA: bifunctional glutamate N-acetyltransferase/amino-acid acetyltransferase ArgJ [Gammaproteobacteria bacterium]